MQAPGTVVDVVFATDGVTVVNGACTEDRNLIMESLSVGGGSPLLPTASGVTVDQGDGAAFDGIDTLPGWGGLWWNASLHFAVHATNIVTGSTLIVRAKATLAGGIGANMVVRVGGVVIGSETVNNTAAYADYSFPIPGAGGGSGATATGWSYDANSLPVAIVQKSGGLETGRWTLGYSGSGDVTSIADVTGGASATVVSDGSGRMTRVTANNGAYLGQQWNSRGLLAGTQTAVFGTAITHDARGLVSTLQIGADQLLRFTYDTLGNPVSVSDSAGQVWTVASGGRGVEIGRLIAESLVPTLQQGLARGFSALLPDARAQLLPPPSIPPGLMQGLGMSSVAGAATAEAAMDGSLGSKSNCLACKISAAVNADQRRWFSTVFPAFAAAYSLTTEVAAATADDWLMLRSTKKLEGNMCNQLGITRPTREQGCYALHHIVQVSKRYPEVVASQEILKKFGMEIDDGNNGVYLKCKDHNVLHRQTCRVAVLNSIMGATSYADLSLKLRLIAVRLQTNGTYP